MAVDTKQQTFDDIKTKAVLEDSDLDLIAQEAQKERLQEKKEKETGFEETAPEKDIGKEKVEVSEEEKKAAEDKEAADKVARETEDKKKEDDAILSAKEEELKPEQKARKTEILKAKDEDFQKEVAEYAKSKEITPEEAKIALEHRTKIQERYSKNPKEVLDEHLSLQRSNTNMGRELKALKEKASQPPPMKLNIENVIKLVDEGAIKNKDGKPISREMVIEGYRKEYADITETMDDETVLKMAAKDYIKGYETSMKESHAQMSLKAKEKRAEIKKSISEADKEYLPDIEPIIDNLPDQAILQEGFSLADTISWAKGKKFDIAVKEAEERGYKRGKEEAKILGEKKTPEGSKPAAKKAGRVLSASEKKRALDKYDGQPISDEEKYRLHALELEEYEQEHKKKKE